ncbi:MAG: glutamate--tRNA ligase [Candidatus Pacebacteria bacterium]|nr:glutamate--tRNA ligase [Candidatus Paceibacterota bacterium]
MSKEEKTKIRARLAPSPTGFLHIGTARTGLFNYLFAKKNKGEFILRIEDTDEERSEERYEKDIIDGLKWLGIEWDEGPGTGGQFAPYRQSERKDSYRKYLQKLLDEKLAYYCFCTEEELEAKKQDQMSRGEAPKYNGKCAGLSASEVERKMAEGEKAVIRFKPPSRIVSFKDLIRGEVEFDSSLFGDFVIAKDLDNPLYNFAVIIDDYEMEISHVIRGEDHISNTPKQILIQEALGLPQLQYAHLPLILGPDKSKLSKRHGAVSLTEYKKEGYLPEAMVNFMAFMGWNPDTEKEIFSLKELVKAFSIEKVQKGGAVFNIQRLDYLNGFYIRQKTLDELAELCLPHLVGAGLISKDEVDMEKIKEIISLYQERLKKLSELPELADFFFKEKIEYDKELLKWKDMSLSEIESSLDISEKILSDIKEGDFNKDNLEKVLMEKAGEMGDRGKLLWPLRAAMTGKRASAGPFEVAAVLGKEKALQRIKEAKNKL